MSIPIDSVQNVLRQLFAQRDLESQLRKYRAWRWWPSVVGPQVAARARPIRLRKDILEIQVDHPVWMQQLQLLKPRILARLNEALGETLITDLYLRYGHTATVPAPPPARPALPGNWQQQALSEEDTAHLQQLAAGLSDPELQQRLLRLLELQRRLEKAREAQGEA